MITRRTLFGLTAGAAVCAVAPTAKATTPRITELDFGKHPAMIEFKDGYIIKFDDPLPDGYLK
jgi:hypothetical protein